MKKLSFWPVVAALWLFLLVGALASVSRRSHQAALKYYALVEKPPFSELSPGFLDVVTLGHRGVVDDALLFHALNYLMDVRLRQMDPAQVEATLKATTRLKPKIESIYMLGCLMLALEFNRPESCEPIITDGIGLFPDGWRLPVTLGTILFHNMKNDARAAIFYELAARSPDAPRFAKRLAIKLRDRSSMDLADLEAIIETLGPVLGEDAVRKFYLSGGGHK